MRICLNTYPVAFQCPGGGEIQLLESMKALQRRGHDVSLFNQWDHDLDKIDVFHQFSVQGGTYNISSYCRQHSIPLVVSPILWLSENTDEYPMEEIRAILAFSNIICPNSLAEIDRFTKHFDFPRNKYRVTHNGLDKVFFEEVKAAVFFEKYSVPKNFVLCVGNIETRKNQQMLLEASRKVGVFTILIGNIREKEYFAGLQQVYGDSFLHLSYLEHGSDLLRSAYAACGVFCLPSLLETPGLAALEAAASGAPLVVTKEGCTEEYFGKHAYYVDPKSVEDIAEKILVALQTGRRGSDQVNHFAQFTWDRVAEELESVYLEAVSAAEKSV